MVRFDSDSGSDSGRSGAASAVGNGGAAGGDALAGVGWPQVEVALVVVAGAAVQVRRAG